MTRGHFFQCAGKRGLDAPRHEPRSDGIREGLSVNAAVVADPDRSLRGEDHHLINPIQSYRAGDGPFRLQSPSKIDPPRCIGLQIAFRRVRSVGV